MSETLRVLVRDEAAIKNRIYGIAANGIPFIREDIISEGNRDQIKEAIDHERRELTAEDHDNIRAEQYQGGLRNFITELSDKDKSDLVGGINLNEIQVDRQGSGVNIHFDPATIQPILDLGVDGYAPVFINFTPITSILPLLGLEPRRKEKEYEIFSVN